MIDQGQTYLSKYFERGFNVIPLKPQTKEPLIEWERFQREKISRDDWKPYHNQDVNYGVVTGLISNLIVVDVDGEPNGWAQDLMDKTLAVKTARGYHLYFEYYNEPIRGFKTVIDGVQIDVKGEGGYVVAPPSIHPNGTQYHFVDKSKSPMHIDGLEEIGLSTKRNLIVADGEITVRPWREFPENIRLYFEKEAVKGKRNDTAIRLSCKMVNEWKFPEKMAWEWLRSWNKLKVDPPLDPRELRKTFDSALKGGYVYGVEGGEARRPEDYFDGKHRFIPKLLADELMEKWVFHSVGSKSNKTVYLYEDGYYKPVGENKIRKEVQHVLKERTKIHYVEEVVKYIQNETSIDFAEFEKNHELIGLQNGVYNTETDEFLPHSPKYMLLQCLPVRYDSEATCPTIEKFMEEIQPNPVDRETLYEWIGYTLLRSYPINKILLTIGDGANGKTTFMNMVKAFLGKDNFSTESLQSLETNRYALSRLVGKLANIHPELSDKKLNTTGQLKALVGGDDLSAERKYHDRHDFLNHAKLFFSANKFPEVKDESSAFSRRLCIIPFNQTFIGVDDDKEMKLKITTPQELSGLFNKAVFHLKKLLARGDFANAKPIEELRKQYLLASNPVAAFCNERLESAPTNAITKTEMYLEYIEYCRTNKLPAISDNAFARKLPQYIRVESGDRGRRHCWIGVKFFSEDDQEDDQQQL